MPAKLPLYCPKCDGKHVEVFGHDPRTSTARFKNTIYRCLAESCRHTFTEKSLKAHETRERMKD